jgi:drug/metabolite transporter (DMT)-like permease
MESSSNSQKREIRFMPRSPFALALMANVIWGTSFLASKYTLKVWGPFTASALRFALALVGMLLLLPAMGFPIQIPRTKKAWTQIFWVGLTGFGVLYPLQLAGLMAIPLQATEPKSSLFDGTAPPVYHFRRFDLYHFMT